MAIFGVANFGRPQLQYDTFELAKLHGMNSETSSRPPPERESEGDFPQLKTLNGEMQTIESAKPEPKR